MHFKSALKQVPFFLKLHRVLTARRRRSAVRRKNAAILSEMENIPYPHALPLRAILENPCSVPPAELEWIRRIEAERNQLLSEKSLLVDGTLGEGGLYDSGQSIAKVCQVSKPPKPASMLYLVTRAVNPRNVIELGTNVGISSAYIAAALKVNGQGGRLTTLDASPYRQRLAKEVHNNLGLDNIEYVPGLFADTLRVTLADAGAIDMAFIDGHHEYKPTIDYFDEIYKSATPAAVFVFDDIRWSSGMMTAWSEIQADRRLGLIVDLESVGICVPRLASVPKRYVLPTLEVF